jgi:hypothetical protein
MFSFFDVLHIQREEKERKKMAGLAEVVNIIIMLNDGTVR